VIQYENALPQTTQLIGPPEPSWVAMSGRPGTASDLEERRDREEGEVSSHFEQCANELPGSGRPGEFQEDRATVGFDGDSEPKKAAAVALGFDRASNSRECFVCRHKSKPKPFWQVLAGFRTLQQIGQESRATRPKRIRRQGASDWQVGHGLEASQ
jgi:hypothetical protein